MTTINRPCRRETAATLHSRGRNRPIVVIMEPPGTTILLRLKGERRSVVIGVREVYSLAARAMAQARKAQRRAERAARRKAK